jgi:hypothetical protein
MTGGFVGFGRSAKMHFYPIHDSQGQISQTSFGLNSVKFRNILNAGSQLLLIHHGSFWADDDPLASCVHFESEQWVHFSLKPLRDALRALIEELSRREGSSLTGMPARDVQQQAVSATDNHFVFHLQTREGEKLVGALTLPDAKAEGEVWHDAAVSGHFDTSQPFHPGLRVGASVSFVSAFPSDHALCDSPIYEEVSGDTSTHVCKGLHLYNFSLICFAACAWNPTTTVSMRGSDDLLQDVQDVERQC